jgi:hypothetical protein
MRKCATADTLKRPGRNFSAPRSIFHPADASEATQREAAVGHGVRAARGLRHEGVVCKVTWEGTASGARMTG